ncbi:MAG: DUF4333 domain-containing protein [Nocardioides sp.]
MRKSAALIVSLLVSFTGCSVSAGSGDDDPEPWSTAHLEDEVTDDITLDDKDAEFTVECAGGLENEKDATQDCNITTGEDEADVHVVVTELDDGEISDYDVNTYLPGDRVAEAIKSSLADQGVNADTVDCEGELAGEKGATMSCTATAGTDTGEIAVEATEVDGLFINFHFEVK